MTRGRIDVLTDAESLEEVFAVRRTVFVEEQDVSEDVEYDGRDGEATHFVARVDGSAVGTARLRTVDDDTGKVERVAVLREFRGEGLGRRLMERVEQVARDRNVETLILHAQRAVETFYRDCGYETTSDTFEEAGIPHVEMEKGLD